MSRVDYSHFYPYIQPTGTYDSILISYAGFHFAIAAETVYNLDNRRIRRFSDTIVWSCTGSEEDIANVNNWICECYKHNVPRGGETVASCANKLYEKLFTVHPTGDRELVITGLDHYGCGCIKVYGPHRYFKNKNFHLGGMHAFEFKNEREKFAKIKDHFENWVSDDFASRYIRRYYRSMHNRNLLRCNLVMFNIITEKGIKFFVDDLRAPLDD